MYSSPGRSSIQAGLGKPRKGLAPQNVQKGLAQNASPDYTILLKAGRPHKKPW
jgi:hypothetical protein